METPIKQNLIPRKKLMELYSMSKATVLKLESNGTLKPLYLPGAIRKPYYRIEEVEQAMKPV